ncbi:MAG: adenylate kinase [Sarcina sp.]
MIFIIAGSSHTGKTILAQRLLEKYQYPYLSIDHLKMGIIRSGQTNLTPEDDEKLTDYLWPVIREMIKTAIENKQNLIVEGCYIPYNYKDDFNKNYLSNIKYKCLIFSENYINNNYENIIKHRNVIESRGIFDYPKQLMIKDNQKVLEMCRKYNCDYILIDKDYKVSDIEMCFESI